jgi:DNA invertase Pin-like site-specific DNA recombinase
MPTRSATGKRLAAEGALDTAIYARISLDDVGDAAGVTRQLTDCRALCERHRWPAKEFVDNDISASRYTRKRRPEYLDMLDRVRSGELRRVVCYNIDRLYRRVKELEELIDLAEAGAVEIISLEGDLNLSTGDGRFTARILVSMAEKSSDDSSRRLRRQRAERRSQGLMAGGARAFGWRDQETPDPAETALVVEGMNRVLAGESLSAICQSWNARSISTVKGCRWENTTLRQSLTNPRHAGLMAHHGEIMGGAAWPAIVERATYERVCAVIVARGARFTGIPHRSHLLTRLVVCGRCGENLTRGTSREGAAVLSCNVRKASGTGCGLNIRAEPVEHMVTKGTFHYVDNLTLAELAKGGRREDDSVAVEIELAAVEARQEELGEVYAAGKLNLRAFTAASTKLDAAAVRLRKRLADRAGDNPLVPYAGHPGVLAEVWDKLSMERRRAVITAAAGGEPFTIRPHLGGTRNRFNPARVDLGRLDPHGTLEF